MMVIEVPERNLKNSVYKTATKENLHKSFIYKREPAIDIISKLRRFLLLILTDSRYLFVLTCKESKEGIKDRKLFSTLSL